MSRIDDAKLQLGELFITGFDGKTLSDETSAFFSQARIGGVILFSQNYESPEQVAELTNSIQDCRHELPLWMSVDHEGGKVQRFREPFAHIPLARKIALANSPKLSFEIYEGAARELKSVGINVNYCPVADIDTNPDNPVIGERAYGDNDEVVSKLVSSALRGHLVAGVQPCVKHFPGHGDTREDSHFHLPRVDTPLETLREREFRPFVKAFKARCPMVMTAHIINPNLDPDRPATLSSRTLREILREELRYTRLILSDDMEMKAIADNFGHEEAPRLALQAGCDLLIYRSEGAARRAYEALSRALESGELAPEIVFEAAKRSRSLKAELLGAYQPTDPKAFRALQQEASHQEFRQRVQALQESK